LRKLNSEYNNLFVIYRLYYYNMDALKIQRWPIICYTLSHNVDELHSFIIPKESIITGENVSKKEVITN